MDDNDKDKLPGNWQRYHAGRHAAACRPDLVTREEDTVYPIMFDKYRRRGVSLRLRRKDQILY